MDTKTQRLPSSWRCWICPRAPGRRCWRSLPVGLPCPARGVVNFNSWLEEVWKALRWQTEDEEKMDGVEECGTADYGSFMEYGEQLESDLSYIQYPGTKDSDEPSQGGFRLYILTCS